MFARRFSGLAGAFKNWKMKGSKALIDSYRDITLADLDGKDFGAFVRAAIIGAVALLGGDCQMGGGMNGGTTDMCHMAVTEALVLGRTLGMTVAILFVDVVSAFASVARRLSIPVMPDSEAQWRRHLANWIWQ